MLIFYDGYVSNLSKRVDLLSGKQTWMKIHDCHILMQRLFPIAFAELIDKSVREAQLSNYSFSLKF